MCDGDTTSLAAAAAREARELQEVLEFSQYSYLGRGYHGTAVFDISATAASPATVFHVTCRPGEGTVSCLGEPPDGEFTIRMKISREDFFRVYRGTIGAVELGLMCAKGAVRLYSHKRGAPPVLMGFIDIVRVGRPNLLEFQASFDMSVANWVRFFRRDPARAADVARLLSGQWEVASRKGAAWAVNEDAEVVEVGEEAAGWKAVIRKDGAGW